MRGRQRDLPTVTGIGALRPRRDGTAVTPRVVALRLHRAGARTVEIELRVDSRYMIGRHEGVDVSFESAEVSRMHGALLCEGGRWHYHDLGSSNGSALLSAEEAARGDAGEPSPLEPMEKVALDIGDQVLLGGWESRVELCAPTPTATPPDDPTLRSSEGRAFAAKIELAARTKVPVFLLGGSGTGKTHTARQIHLAATPDAPFVPLNCARLPHDPTSLHSELLGHVKGAFTGAAGARTGSFFAANGGTLFLDEVESLASTAQGFLLDVLEGTGDPSPLGAPSRAAAAPVFRLVSASKVPLGDSGLRPDLCERLAEGHLWRMPSLEERRADIPGLMLRFADEQSKMLGVDVGFTDEALTWSAAAAWPGQIRQLRATVIVLAQAAVAQAAGGSRATKRIVLRSDDVRRHLDERQAAFATSSKQALKEALPGAPSTGADAPLKRFARSLERDDVAAALARADGNQSAAARELGIARNTLVKKMRDFGLK